MIDQSNLEIIILSNISVNDIQHQFVSCRLYFSVNMSKNDICTRTKMSEIQGMYMIAITLTVILTNKL